MKRILLLALLGAYAPAVSAQHPQPAHAGATDTASHAGHTMTGVLGLPQSREGSGTSWLPDLSPMHALHATAGDWSLMLHGNVFLQYISQGSDRGKDQFGSINWVMGMARREFLGGELGLRAMVSAEPWTISGCGYPILLATGELCDGAPIVDEQHPHDLFMELAAEYGRAFTNGTAFELYGAAAGEPALGPVAFPHRTSAMLNPLAPISHHWFDATHIAFGVATAGLYGRQWKVEGSLFNGREPDEDRKGIDLAPLDSYSGRLWWMPNDRWALQVSAGQLNEAEPGHDVGGPRVDVTRYTASATHHRPVMAGGIWATTAALGRNVEEGTGTNALLIETSLAPDTRNQFFGRAEWTEKAGHDLDLAHELEDEVFSVAQLSLGYVRQFGPVASLLPGIGVQGSVSFLPEDLEPYYGERNPLGFTVFASLHPAPMRMEMPVPVAPMSMQGHASMEHQGMPHDRMQGGMQEGMEHHAMMQGDPLDLTAIQVALETAGIRLGAPSTVQQPFWKVPTHTYPLPEAQTPNAALQVNVYASPMAVHEDAMERKPAMPAWVAPPNYFHVRNALLVLLADPARDAELIRSVERAVRSLGGMRMPHPPGMGGAGH